MEVNLLPGALPLLAPPSGDTLKFRKRNNDLDELEEEALRVQIRQHIGASVFSGKSARAQQERYRDARSNSAMSVNDAANESVSLTNNNSSSGDASLSAMWSSSSFLSVSEVFKLVQRMLWFADEDMAEEIDESDPKIQAGKKFLAGVEAFAMLTENELAQLVGLSEFRAFSAGETVIEDERDADGLYIVMTGGAARFAAMDGSLDGVLPSETFGYQEHFGVFISPTEAMSTERAETAVVATSDILECIWLSELVVRMLNIQPRLEHEFVLILHNYRALSEELLKSQEELLLRLLRAGLHVTVMANTRNTTNSILLLLSAPLWLLAREDKLMAMERIIENHAEEDTRNVGDDYEYHGETMTASDRISAFASILTRSPADKPPGVGLRGIENNLDPVVRDVFPLHDPSMTDFILSTWFKETHSASTKRLFLLRIKDYFGLRIAFFTAFVRLYNAALVYPLNVGVLLWLFWRWIHYRSYAKALGVYGLCIAFIWAPSFLKRWKRYQNSLLVEWNLLGTKEVAQPNPEFRDFVVETINVSNEGEPPDYVEVKTYDYRRRWPKYAIFAILCTVCLLLLFVFVGVYVQWYIIAVMTPMCTDPRCPEFLDATDGDGCVAHCNELFAQGKSYLFMKHISSCTRYCDVSTFDRNYYRCNAPLVGCFHTERGILGTARWFYVLVQGIVLGLTLDIVFLAIFEAIAMAFNRWENYQTEQEREKRCIEKIFLFNWVGYFYWFFLLAFVYVPNGDNVQRFVQTHVDGNGFFSLNNNVHFSRYWVDGLISMDSAFVTPMIVTQALNLVINTFVPYLLRRAIIRARDSYHVKRERLSSALKMGKTKAAVAMKGGSVAPAAPGGDAHSEASLDASNYTEYSLFNEADRWIHLTEHVDRHEASRMLAEREPIGAHELDAAVRELFSSISSHDNHMHEICGGLARDDLDSHQLTSYEWIDRVMRSIEDMGSLKGLWDSGPPAAETTAGSAGNSPKDPGTTTTNVKCLKIRLITQWQCRNYNYTADRLMEESSMPTYSPFGDLLHLAIQFSYTIMFSVVWPFCCLCSFCRNAVALRFDAIKMTIDCKRPVPRRTVGIGPWLGAFMFEIAIAQIVVPALFVYVGGQFDAFFPTCEISEARYGPSPCLSPSERLVAFCTLENVGIAICLLVYWKKSDISNQTTIKIVAHSRKLRHNLRKSVRMIGETILVSSSLVSALRKQQHEKPGGSVTLANGSSSSKTGSQGRANDLLYLSLDDNDPTSMFTVDLAGSDDIKAPVSSSSMHHNHRRRHPNGSSHDIGASSTSPSSLTAAVLQHTDHLGEWREGTVSWVKNGRIKVNFSGGRQLGDGGLLPSSSSSSKSDEFWLTNNERHVLMDPMPVKIFEVGMPVLLASRKFGRWLEATVTGLDNKDRFGNEVPHAPTEMHVRLVEAQNLRSFSLRHSSAAAALVDPYCVLTVGAFFKHSTSVKRRAVNPVWDELVEFPLLEKELYSDTTASAARTDSRSMSSSVSAASRQTSFNGNGAQSNRQIHSSRGGGIGAAPLRTVKVGVFNNDPFAMNECLGEVEIDLNQFRDGQRHRLLVPLSHKRHIWTREAIQSLMRKQALGAADYPVLGMPHLLLELQWIDTRLPTKVAVRVRGQAQSELVLSRKFCETSLCYGISADQVEPLASGLRA